MIDEGDDDVEEEKKRKPVGPPRLIVPAGHARQRKTYNCNKSKATCCSLAFSFLYRRYSTPAPHSVPSQVKSRQKKVDDRARAGACCFFCSFRLIPIRRSQNAGTAPGGPARRRNSLFEVIWVGAIVCASRTNHSLARAPVSAFMPRKYQKICSGSFQSATRTRMLVGVCVGVRSKYVCTLTKYLQEQADGRQKQHHTHPLPWEQPRKVEELQLESSRVPPFPSRYYSRGTNDPSSVTPNCLDSRRMEEGTIGLNDCRPVA